MSSTFILFIVTFFLSIAVLIALCVDIYKPESELLRKLKEENQQLRVSNKYLQNQYRQLKVANYNQQKFKNQVKELQRKNACLEATNHVFKNKLSTRYYYDVNKGE